MSQALFYVPFNYFKLTLHQLNKVSMHSISKMGNIGSEKLSNFSKLHVYETEEVRFRCRQYSLGPNL